MANQSSSNLLFLQSKRMKMGQFNRQVVETESKHRFILNSASAPFVVDTSLCKTGPGTLHSQNHLFGITYTGHRVNGTVGHLKEDIFSSLLRETNQPKFTGSPPTVLCVPQFRKGAPDAKGNKLVALNKADGIIGLGLAGGEQQCSPNLVDGNPTNQQTCYSNSDLNILSNMNMDGFSFGLSSKPQQAISGELCGLHGVTVQNPDPDKGTTRILAPIPQAEYDMNKVRTDKAIKVVYPSHCQRKIFDIGWPAKEDPTPFNTAYNVDMINEKRIRYLETDYKNRTIRYELHDGIAKN